MLERVDVHVKDGPPDLRSWLVGVVLAMGPADDPGLVGQSVDHDVERRVAELMLLHRRHLRREQRHPRRPDVAVLDVHGDPHRAVLRHGDVGDRSLAGIDHTGSLRPHIVPRDRVAEANRGVRDPVDRQRPALVDKPVRRHRQPRIPGARAAEFLPRERACGRGRHVEALGALVLEIAAPHRRHDAVRPVVRAPVDRDHTGEQLRPVLALVPFFAEKERRLVVQRDLRREGMLRVDRDRHRPGGRDLEGHEQPLDRGRLDRRVAHRIGADGSRSERRRL